MSATNGATTSKPSASGRLRMAIAEGSPLIAETTTASTAQTTAGGRLTLFKTTTDDDRINAEHRAREAGIEGLSEKHGSWQRFLTHAGRTSPENGLDAIFKRVFMNISLYAFRERFTLAGACRY